MSCGQGMSTDGSNLEDEDGAKAVTAVYMEMW